MTTEKAANSLLFMAEVIKDKKKILFFPFILGAKFVVSSKNNDLTSISICDYEVEDNR